MSKLTEEQKEALKQRAKIASQKLINILGVSNLEKVAIHLENNPLDKAQLLAFIKLKM